MTKKTIWVSNQILNSNINILKSIAILFESNYNDLIFIPNFYTVEIKLKGKDSKSIGAISHDIYKNMLLSIKISTNLNLIHSLSQSTSFYAFIDKKKYYFRASIHPASFLENLSIRIIKSEIFSFNYFNFDFNIEIKPGLNFIGGRTCSGKTTLFYTMLSNFVGHVISIEDPIESHINVVQTEVSQIGYDNAIRSALRQNPDLIAIGEIRNKESAQAAIRASLTGHSVLATIHISDINGLYNRLEELGCLFIQQTISQLLYIDKFTISQKIFDI